MWGAGGGQGPPHGVEGRGPCSWVHPRPGEWTCHSCCPPQGAGLPEPQTSAFSVVRAVPPSLAFSEIPALPSHSLTASPDRLIPGEVSSPCTWGSPEPSETRSPPHLSVPAWMPLPPGDTLTLHSPFPGFRANPAQSHDDCEIVEHSPGASKGPACSQK